MNLGHAFTYATDDPGWQKKVIYTLVIGVIPLVNFAAMGWAMDLIRNMLDGAEHPMPEWIDLSNMDQLINQLVERWVTGLMVLIAGLIYYIPIILVNIVFGIVSGVLFSGDSFGAVAMSTVLACCQGLIGAIYSAVIWLPLTVGISRYARSRNFSEFLQFGANLQGALNHFSTMLVLVILVFVYSFLLAIVTAIPCIGWLLGLFSFGLGAIVIGHLTGQAARIITGQANTGAA